MSGRFDMPKSEKEKEDTPSVVLHDIEMIWERYQAKLDDNFFSDDDHIRKCFQQAKLEVDIFWEEIERLEKNPIE